MKLDRFTATQIIAGLALSMSVASVEAQDASAPLVQSSNIVHLGSFKLPVVSGNGFSYGGTAITFNPANNSLFVVGHTYDQHMAEVSIPALGGTASILQPLRSVHGGKLASIGQGTPIIGGGLVYKNKLYTTAFIYYDATGSQSVSHFSRPLDLGGGTVTGPYRVGGMGAGYYSGYMASIPAEWQARFGAPAITGNCCLSIISRTSYGPAAFTYDPEKTTSHAQPLVYYTQNNQTLGEYGASGRHPVFNGTTRITGVFFPEGTSSVLFFGSTGVGNYCYGEAAECGDPAGSGKGEHAYPYRAYIWAYNANDLLAVRNGTKQPWSVTPYATWELPAFGNLSPDFSTGGAAYDPSTRRLYLSRKYGDGDRPLIYVYEINNAVEAAAPRPPVNFQVQ